MTPPASPRLAWAAEVAAPRPGDRVLEVGCGHGVLLGLLADRVTEGLVVGLDRSATMTAAAAARNRAAVAAGRVRLRTAALLDADPGTDLGGHPFDLVVAVHVGAFWRPPAHEYGAVRRLLAPNGRLLLVNQPLRLGEVAAMTDQVDVLAAPSGLTVRAVHTADTPPRPSMAVELTPVRRSPMPQ
jgi:SAM-dependent methyltransferase